MALDKLVDSTQLDSDLTSVANAIRTKGGTSAQLSFPSGMVSAIAEIPEGGGGEFDITSITKTDGTQGLDIDDAVESPESVIPTDKAISSVSYNGVDIPLAGGASNLKFLEISITSHVDQNTWVTIVNGDSDIASHMNDPKLTLVFCAKQNQRTLNALALVFSLHSNILFAKYSSYEIYGYAASCVSSSPPFTSTSMYNSIGKNSRTNMKGAFNITSDGNVEIYSASSPIPVGDYFLVATW